MNYRTRTQRFTGKLILVYADDGKDVAYEPSSAIVLVNAEHFDEMKERIRRYENRAAGQRAAIARRAAAQQPATQSEGATPAAPQSLAQE